MFQLIVLFSTVVVIAASNSPKVSPDELRAKWALMAKDLKARQEEVKLKIRNLQEPLREKVAEAKNKLSSVVSDIHQNLQAGVIGIEERPLDSDSSINNEKEEL
uniref:SXP/RAL-2 family protein Ani s 5-like cation-binding domain-containing protein n=1 Tax=Dendroctonus ponderosae TaxID=77166 RepID=A0AAR5PRH7_DENPD